MHDEDAPVTPEPEGPESYWTEAEWERFMLENERLMDRYEKVWQDNPGKDWKDPRQEPVGAGPRPRGAAAAEAADRARWLRCKLRGTARSTASHRQGARRADRRAAREGLVGQAEVTVMLGGCHRADGQQGRGRKRSARA